MSEINEAKCKEVVSTSIQSEAPQQTNNEIVIKVSTKYSFEKDIGNCGFDLRANEDVTIEPWTRKLVKTDVKQEFPLYMWGNIRSRSGLALKGIDACGGVVDSSYRNLVGIILANNSNDSWSCVKGDRIAQMIFTPCFHPKIQIVTEEELSTTTRGEKGFGSSGMK